MLRRGNLFCFGLSSGEKTVHLFYVRIHPDKCESSILTSMRRRRYYQEGDSGLLLLELDLKQVNRSVDLKRFKNNTLRKVQEKSLNISFHSRKGMYDVERLDKDRLRRSYAAQIGGMLKKGQILNTRSRRAHMKRLMDVGGAREKMETKRDISGSSSSIEGSII
ncbi:hypothetical protein EVAR_97132_1 [Eumeta japonica]|uniref:Uncharacterized protein n=1 Tax=Eumeta variegata TaxID=151549 RepID=A0A4C1WP12_EUMVA|nr:hypothetical protein EVAR_97132_1 [Eumeta japonica]